MNLLQNFLNHQFINIGEDANLTKLKKTCDELVKKLIKNKSKIIPYTLIALDPEVPADDVDVAEVTSNIVKKLADFSFEYKRYSGNCG